MSSGGSSSEPAVVVERDVRACRRSPFEAFARKASEGVAHVVDIGLASTDALYFAVAKCGARISCDLICNASVRQPIAAADGVPIRSKFGHSIRHAEIDRLDDLTIEYPDWLRLNVEGDSRALLEKHRDETVALIRG